MAAEAVDDGDFLIDCVVLVGFEPPKQGSEAEHGYGMKDTVVPTILKKFPQSTRAGSLPITPEVACFCFPKDSIPDTYVANQPYKHVFLLTDKETDIKRYCTCITFASEMQSRCMAEAEEGNGPRSQSPSFQLADVHMLSVAIVSVHPNFTFFAKCLRQLYTFVEDMFAGKVSWCDVFEGQESGDHLAAELHEWLNRLSKLRLPAVGELMEVELAVKPPAKLCVPPPRRFPVAEVPIHQLFDLLSMETVLKLFRLLLCEEKVLMYSAKYWLVPEAVLSMATLLYPFSYLYPLIPLLPSSLPDAENLLLVPTPYFIGVHSSFCSKLEDYHTADVWLVNIDSDEVTPPHDSQPIPELPASHHELKADIQQLLAKADGLKVCGEDSRIINDILDTELQTAFLKFLLAPDMLGNVLKHMYIIRLFPRPTVSLKSHSFSNEYHEVAKQQAESSSQFVQRIISSQCVRNFLEWTLNPDNTAFIEVIGKGVTQPNYLSSRLSLLVNHEHLKAKQVALYRQDSSSLLYQAMLEPSRSSRKGRRSLSSSVQSGGSEELEGRMLSSGEEEWVYIPMNEEDDLSVQQEESTDGSRTGTSIEMEPLGHHKDNASNLPQGSLEEDSSTAPPDTGLNRLQVVSSENTVSQSWSASPNPFARQPSWALPTLPSKGIPHGSFILQPVFLPSPSSWSPSALPAATPPQSRAGVSSHHSATESMCLSLVQRVLDGQGLPWMKSSLEAAVSSEDHRTTMLKALQEKLGLRVLRKDQHSSNTCELNQVGVSKSVYNGICDLFRYMWKGIIQEFIVSPDCKIDSVFLLFRLACYVYLDETVLSRSGSRKMTSVRVSTPRMDPSANESELFQTATAAAGGDGGSALSSSFPGLDGSPESKLTAADIESHDIEGGGDEDAHLNIPRGRPMVDMLGGFETMKRYHRIKEQHSRSAGEHYPTEKMEGEEGDELANAPEVVERSGMQETASDHSVPFTAPIHSTPKPSTDKHNPDTGDLFFTPLTQTPAEDQKDSEEDIDGASFSRPWSALIPNTHPSARKRPSRNSFSKPVGIPFSRRLSTESYDSLTVLSLSGIGDAQILNKTVLTKLSSVFVIPQGWSRQFWNNLVWSLVTSERACISWNESTAELCKRFHSLDRPRQRRLIEEEDQILSVVLINVTLFMAATGISPEETQEMLYRYIAKTRVCDSEGTLLNSLIQELMRCDETCDRVIENFSLLPLYSEANPVVSFLVHRGANMTGQLLKMVITNSCCVLRHFPEGGIFMRLWIDSIEHLQCSEEKEMVSFHHREAGGSHTLHQFYAKECLELHVAIRQQLSRADRK